MKQKWADYFFDYGTKKYIDKYYGHMLYSNQRQMSAFRRLIFARQFAINTTYREADMRLHEELYI